ncbi:hypothetical protein, partial [Citrobacter sp. wls707]
MRIEVTIAKTSPLPA